MNIFKHLVASLLIVCGGIFAHADTVGQVQFKFLTSGVTDPRVQATEGRKGTVWVLIPALGGDAVVLVKQDNGVTTNWVPVGTSVASQYISAGTADPTVVAQPGQRGYLYIRTQSGAVGLYQKQSNTSPGTDWVAFGTGSTPTGDINSVAFFNTSGDLSSSLGFRYDDTEKTLAVATYSSGGVISPNTGGVIFGSAVNTSSIAAANNGLAIGSADGASSISSDSSLVAGSVLSSSSLLAQNQSFVHGAAVAGGSILASGVGSSAQGRASGGTVVASGIGSAISVSLTGSGSAASASGDGAAASGFLTSGGQMSVSGNGSRGQGYANGSGSTLISTGSGSVVGGYVTTGADITVPGNGAYAHGYAASNGAISSHGPGAFSIGYASGQNKSIQTGTATAFAGGYVAGPGSSTVQIASTGTGSFAYGNITAGTDDAASIQSVGAGTFALGVVYGIESVIYAEANGSLAGGYNPADNTYLAASGDGSFVWGMTSADGDHLATNPGATSFGISNSTYSYAGTTFGRGNINASEGSLVIGRYSDASGTADTWVTTEPVFAIGNGTSTVSRSNSYSIDKDGRINISAQSRNSAIRVVSASANVSARTDRVIFVDTAAAGGPVTITFPVGEDGLEYYVRDIGSNASVNNIVFAASGGDTILGTPSIISNSGMRQFIFYGGVWYVISRFN